MYALMLLALAYPLFKLAEFLYEEYTSPLNRLPGPKSTSWLYGNFKEIWENDLSVVYEKWIDTYGPTFKYKDPVGITRFFTIDAKAITHVLMNSHIYEKPAATRYELGQVLGDGLLVAEGERHTQQRKIINPAFGPAQIRELTGIFIDKAIELREGLEAEITKQAGPVGPVAYVNILPWLSRTTLDVIGLAGFNYQFNALSGDGEKETNELYRAFAMAFSPESRLPLIPFIRGLIPVLRFLPAERDAEIRAAKKATTRIGHGLLEQNRATEKMSSLGKNSWKGRDLLSLLIRANMATDLPSTERMTDDDMVAQVCTFLVAGYDTTSVATTWALFALAKHPEIQDKLREELFSIPTDHPTMDELNSLPYFECFMRETMRVHPPVPSTMRVATQDDMMPLGKPVQDEDGNTHEFIKIKKGQTILVPILTMHRAVEIWGEDAKEFKPERWESVPQAANGIPGVWGNLLSFLGGRHSCIGYRYSVTEIKALLFALLRGFEFQLAVPADSIKGTGSIIQRPVLTSDPTGKVQLPLLIKVYQGP